MQKSKTQGNKEIYREKEQRKDRKRKREKVRV
jgi:hypothetical protein